MIVKYMIWILMIEMFLVFGNFGRVVMVIGFLGGDIGEVEMVKVGFNYIMWNIIV